MLAVALEELSEFWKNNPGDAGLKSDNAIWVIWPWSWDSGRIKGAIQLHPVALWEM